MNRETTSVILSVILSVSIVYLISLGLSCFLMGYVFIGYLNFILGGLAVYYLSLKYFEVKLIKDKK